MNAAFFYGPNEIHLREVELDYGRGLEDGSQVLKVLSCSVCSYDVRTFRNGSFKVKTPIILGHEICAETINDYSSQNFSIKSNTRVSVYPIIPCFDCWYCQHCRYNLCQNLREIGSTVNGGFAEFIKVPNNVFEIGGIVPVLDNVTKEEASLIEPLACCINGISQVRSMLFESVIIIGDGPIGLLQLMLLKKYFSDVKVTVIGKIKHRLDKAHKLGADKVVFFEHDKNNFERYKSLKHTNGKISPNLIMVSNNSLNSLPLAFYLANKNGNIVIFSGFKNPLPQVNPSLLIDMDPNLIHYNQISVFGSFSSNPENMLEAMNLVNTGEINIKELITTTHPLSEIIKAFEVSESYRGFKSVINRF
jgi:L-iditol 2-dehydrogenase